MVISLILLSLIGSASKTIINNQDLNKISNEETEFWALLVAVGEYADDPRQDRPDMLKEVDDLYDLLLQSDIWSEDHIKVIKAEDATVSNILYGLRWLDKMEESSKDYDRGLKEDTERYDKELEKYSERFDGEIKRKSQKYDGD